MWAWRGDRPPSDPLALIDHIRGVVVRKAGGDRPNEQRPEHGQQKQARSCGRSGAEPQRVILRETADA
jgi:hypothetical protein